MFIRIVTWLLVAGCAFAGAPSKASEPLQSAKNGSVIFFHPDGAGLNHWNALRLYSPGPDGTLNWDKLPGMAVYKGHMSDSVVATSHGGATVHAYGIKVPADSFGMRGGEKIVAAASGKPLSLLQEAKAAGKAVGLVNTGHIAEPGTAVFAASVQSRTAGCEIAKQVVLAGADVVMGGGEKFLLPIGVAGRHGVGACVENLIERAKADGYTLVYTREELAQLAAKNFEGVSKLFGVFAHNNTYNDDTEEENQKKGLPNYSPVAPTIAEMGQAALAILSRSNNGFFLVAEEEGTDNLANVNNANAQFEALKRADEAVGVFSAYIKANPNTLLLMAADSEAGGLNIISSSRFSAETPLPANDANGAPYDGVGGAGTFPFMSAPDASGNRFPFAVAWGTRRDTTGSVLVRGEGYNSNRISGTMDNTEMYKLMHLTLFGPQAGQLAAK